MAAHGKIQEYKKIQSNYVFLTEDLKKGIDGVIRSLFNKGIIDDNHKSILSHKGTDGDTRPKVEELLDILMYSGEGAYDAFIETLKELKCTKAVAKLEQGDQQQPQPSTSGRLEKKRGPMKKEDLHVILQEYPCLLDTIDVQHVQPFLVQGVILERKDTDRLRKALKEGSREKATEELLEIVMYESGSDVFPIFVKCLNNAGYEELANKLQPSLYFKHI